MSLYNEWKSLAYEQENEEALTELWKTYCDIEKGIYEKILSDPTKKVQGTIEELAKEFEVEPVYFMGFLDGINDSLNKSLDLETLESSSSIELDISLEKLYYNMLAAKAEWLYTLPQWDDILTEERRKEITKEYKASKTIVKGEKIGRNEPCPCGSGKKYKKCCGAN